MGGVVGAVFKLTLVFSLAQAEQDNNDLNTLYVIKIITDLDPPPLNLSRNKIIFLLPILILFLGLILILSTMRLSMEA